MWTGGDHRRLYCAHRGEEHALRREDSGRPHDLEPRLLEDRGERCLIPLRHIDLGPFRDRGDVLVRENHLPFTEHPGNEAVRSRAEHRADASHRPLQASRRNVIERSVRDEHVALLADHVRELVGDPDSKIVFGIAFASNLQQSLRWINADVALDPNGGQKVDAAAETAANIEHQRVIPDRFPMLLDQFRENLWERRAIQHKDEGKRTLAVMANRRRFHVGV